MSAPNGKNRTTGRWIAPRVVVERIPKAKDDGTVTSFHPFTRGKLLMFRVPRFSGCGTRVGMTGFYNQRTGKLRVERQSVEQWRMSVFQFERGGGGRDKSLQVVVRKLDVLRALKAE